MSNQKCQLADFLNSMRRWVWTHQPRFQLLDSRHLGRLFRWDELCVLAKPRRSFQILQRCLEEGDECWINLDAVLLFQMCRQLHSRNITDFRNSTSEKFHRFHQHPPGDLLEPGMYRQAGRSVFNEGSWRGPMVHTMRMRTLPHRPVRDRSEAGHHCPAYAGCSFTNQSRRPSQRRRRMEN
jgi:hypothetical protein